MYYIGPIEVQPFEVYESIKSMTVDVLFSWLKIEGFTNAQYVNQNVQNEFEMDDVRNQKTKSCAQGEQNGVAESINRILVEKARTILND